MKDATFAYSCLEWIFASRFFCLVLLFCLCGVWTTPFAFFKRVLWVMVAVGIDK